MIDVLEDETSPDEGEVFGAILGFVCGFEERNERASGDRVEFYLKKVERQSKRKFSGIIARELRCAWSRGEDYEMTRADSSTCKGWVSTEIRKGSVTTKPFRKKRGGQKTQW